MSLMYGENRTYLNVHTSDFDTANCIQSIGQNVHDTIKFMLNSHMINNDGLDYKTS